MIKYHTQELALGADKQWKNNKPSLCFDEAWILEKDISKNINEIIHSILQNCSTETRRYCEKVSGDAAYPIRVRKDTSEEMNLAQNTVTQIPDGMTSQRVGILCAKILIWGKLSLLIELITKT